MCLHVAAKCRGTCTPSTTVPLHSQAYRAGEHPGLDARRGSSRPVARNAEHFTSTSEKPASARGAALLEYLHAEPASFRDVEA
jgi:hypothetical protein